MVPAGQGGPEFSGEGVRKPVSTGKRCRRRGAVRKFRAQPLCSGIIRSFDGSFDVDFKNASVGLHRSTTLCRWVRGGVGHLG